MLFLKANSNIVLAKLTFENFRKCFYRCYFRCIGFKRGFIAWYLRLQLYKTKSVSLLSFDDCAHVSKGAIQSRAILPIVKGRDVIAQAQSGTGKTATFSISILQSIDISLRETQALVLSPTRELATQIQSVILALGDYMNVSLLLNIITLFLRETGTMSCLYWWYFNR